MYLEALESVCTSFLILSLKHSQRVARSEKSQARWWSGGERATDRKVVDVMERQTGRESGSGRQMRETEQSLQHQYVRLNLQDEAAKKKKKSNQFPHCWRTPNPRICGTGASQSELCMKHRVTHVASVLSAASGAGAQMAMAILTTAPPPGRRGLRWRFPYCVGRLSTHYGPVFNSRFLPINVNPDIWGVGWRKEFAMGRRDICMACMKRSGLGAFCGSNINETLERQQRWNPGSSTKLCQAAGESCQCRRLNLYRPSLSLTLALASLWLIVSALQTLSILFCLKLDADSKRKNESIFGCCKQKGTVFVIGEFSLPCLCATSSLSLLLVHARRKASLYFFFFLIYWS